jgi:phosphoribosylaminoimidazole-succinocarboxamide synthase
MSLPKPLHQSTITSLPKIHAGKVRDIFAVGERHMLLVSTDRLSAFDVILPQSFPGKGGVLTRLTSFWMRHFEKLLPNQMAPGMRLADWLDARELAECEGRAVIVKKLKALPVECVARGYLIGSGWKEYQQSGTVCGIALPRGLPQAAKLEEPIFTPAWKAPAGEHDVNITYDRAVELVGAEVAAQLKHYTLTIYREAAAYALARGILIADTKFEFGVDEAGTVHLIDEVLTPDSSRFWPADQYRPGVSPPSFDKQLVRDTLEAMPWDKRPPAPLLPQDIIERTAAIYAEAERRLTT